VKINIELSQQDLIKLVHGFFEEQLSGMTVNPDFIRIEVKSKQNYKSEWEQADFRAVYERSV